MDAPDENRAVTYAEFQRLETKVDELTTSTAALVEAWKAAGGIVKFVKLTASLIAAAGVIWFFLTHGFTKAP